MPGRKRKAEPETDDGSKAIVMALQLAGMISDAPSHIQLGALSIAKEVITARLAEDRLAARVSIGGGGFGDGDGKSKNN